MPLNPTLLNKLQTLLNQIASERVLAKAHKDDGMLPINSLLGEFIETSASVPSLAEAGKRVHGAIDSLLDEAKPFDEPTLQYVGLFTSWAQQALEACEQDKTPEAFPSMDASKLVSSTTASTEPDEDKPEDILMEINLDDDREVLEEFHNEAQEHLEQIESVLLTLENDPEDADSLSAIFRSFHTIKGVAGFLHLIPIQSLAHEIESLLDLARNKKLVLNTRMITTILNSKDTIATLVAQVNNALSDGSMPEEIVPVSHLILEARAAAQGKLIEAEQPEPEEPEDATPETHTNPQAAKPEKRAPRLTTPATTRNKPAAKASSIRVNTEKLDNLMDTVGELVITQSQLQESAKEFALDNSPLTRNLSQLARISKELQHTSMSLRMVPIGPTFQKMSRIVRDVSGSLNKKIRFTTSGEETELDRNVVEMIGDPLVHMVRNAVDHGIEAPEARRSAGKDEFGRVELNAYHMGGSIVIDLKDDGKGLDPEKLLDKARSKGLVSPDQEFTEEEIYNFIFLPGFSTAAQVTDVSGRGVGMDVVRQNIENLRGQVVIDSKLGHGSVFKIKLPLTTAIIDGLLVRVGSDRFIIPTLSVKVALRPERYQIKTMQNNLEILDLRGQSIPILHLHKRFGIPNAITDPSESIIVILETMGRPIGLMVDAMIGKQEVVIKSLGSALRNLPGIAGGAILGDGNIALILDPASLGERN